MIGRGQQKVRWGLLVWIAAIGGLILPTSCAPERSSGIADRGILVITEAEQTSTFVRNFNPFFEWGDVRWPTRRAMYEPLFIFNILSGKYTPWLATGYEWSESNKKLTIHIREGVKWSDGKSFGAGDVVFTFKLMKRFAALDTRGVWKYIEKLEVDKNGDVVLGLRRSYVPILDYIAHQPIVPGHLWKNVGNPVEFLNENPVATGPFTEVGRFTTQSYEVHRNPHYWQDGKPAMDTIKFLAFPANEQKNLALIKGDIDWAGDFVPAIDRIFVNKNPQHHNYWFPLIDGMVFMYANTTREPFDDVRVRKALSMAIDRDLVVKVAMYDYTRPGNATGLSDAYKRERSSVAVEKGRDWVTYDPDGACALLDEAGLKPGEDGVRMELELMVPGGFSDWVRAVQVISRGLKKVGVEARVKAYDFNAWYEKLANGEFDLSVGWSEVRPSTHAFYRSLMSTHTQKPLGEPATVNWHRFGLKSADELLAGMERTSDLEEERRLSHGLQMLFVEHAPAIPLFPGPLWGEYNTTRVTGFPTPDNPYAPLSPNWTPQSLLVLTELKPR